MSMINCPECGKEISDKADRCPNCGCPIQKPQVATATPTKTKGNNGMDVLIAILLFIIPLAPVGIILMWGSKIPKSKGTRILATAIFGIFFLFWISSIGNKENKQDTVQGNTRTEINQGETRNENLENRTQQKEEKEPEIAYTSYSVTQMIDDLNSNALKAETTYKDQYVEITGKLNVIDSSGQYISLYPEDNEWSFIGVQCYIKNEEQKAKVMEMSKGDIVTLKGKIKSVGEILGYSLDIDEIN